jgi:uncharacterized protein (DUF2384 family)
MAMLLTIVKDIVRRSGSLDARDFDAAAWLDDRVLGSIQALGNQRPVDLLGTGKGVESVARVLRAMESGAYL